MLKLIGRSKPILILKRVLPKVVISLHLSQHCDTIQEVELSVKSSSDALPVIKVHIFLPYKFINFLLENQN